MSQFSAENCLSHIAENFCKGILLFLRIFLVSKSFFGWNRGTYHIFNVGKIWSHSTEKFCEHSFNVSEKIVVSENFMYKRVYHVFLSKILGLTVPDKFVGIPSMFQKVWGFRVYFMHRRGYHVFPSKIFSLTVAKWFVRIPSMFQKISVIENFMHDRGVKTFRRKVFVSQCRKNSWASFNVSENFWYRRFLCIIGGITFFCRKVFVSPCRKILQTNPTVFQRISRFEKFFRMIKGGYHNFPSRNFGLTEPKNFMSILARFQKNCGIGNFYVQ